MKWRARIGYLLLAVVVAGGIAYGFMPKPVPAELVEAVTGSLAVTVEEEGRTRVRERYVVAAPVAGHARRIALKVGDRVEAGQTVAVIEPARAADLDARGRAQAVARIDATRAALAAAREQVAAAVAEATLARQELARVETLVTENFVSRAALDQAGARARAAEAGQRAAEYSEQVARHEVEVARAALTRATDAGAGGSAPLRVNAPVAGDVLAVPRESEGAVQPGQALLEIGNPDSLEVVVEVLSTAAVRLAPGTRALFERWGGAATLEGRVRVVEPAGFTKISALGVEEQRVRVIVDFVTPREEWSRLGDGYRVEARFVLWEGDDLLLIPTSALFRHGDGWAAFVAVDGRARLRPLEIGERTGLSARVLGGLRAGERVVAHPDDRVADGVRLRPRAGT